MGTKDIIIKNEDNFNKLIQEKKRILVTGGAGFIGTNLIRNLLENNNKVICLDNLFTSRKENIYEFLENNDFEFLRHDVTEEFSINIDEIYNLACPASPVYYQKDPVYTIKTSFYGALNVLNNAKKNSARVLHTSTSEVYGSPQKHPQSENYWGNVNPIGIRSCYDEGKRAAETLFFDYYREYNVDIAVARVFNTFGPGMSPNDGRVISNFVLQALTGKDITIYGSGEQTRSFCYVDDLVQGLIRLMESDKKLTGPINLGNPNEISIIELANKIISLTDSTSNIIHCPSPANDPIRRKPDIKLAKDELNWAPKVNLEEGLKITIEYFKKFLKDEV